MFRSLYAIVSLIVIVVVSLIMTIVLSYNYQSMKENQINDFQTGSKEIFTRLKQNLVPFITSYSVNEYEKLIANQMKNQNIVAVEVHDYITGTILDQEFYYVGKQKDLNHRVVDLTKSELNRLEYSLKIEEDIVENDQKIGKISIYFTDIYLMEKLNQTIIESIVVIFFLTVALVLFLILGLKVFALQPINDLVLSFSDRDENNLPKNLPSTKGAVEIEHLTNVISDMMTSIKESKQEIILLNERLTRTLEAVDDGIWDWNLKTNDVFFSNRWKSMLGYENDEIKNLSQSFFELIHEEDLANLKEKLERHLKDPQNTIYNVKIRLKCKNNGYKWIRSRGKAYLDKDGTPTRMLGYHSDITNEILQENIMLEQSKMAAMGEMIGNIAHQWRQPLSVISAASTGVLFYQESNMLTKEIVENQMNSINENAQYLSKTIDDFRDFIRGERKLVIFDLASNIDSLLHLIEGSVKSNSITLVKNIQNGIQLAGYPNELLQCFVNIYNNTKDVLADTPDNRYFFITTQKDNEKIQIIFKDNGGGIPDGVMPHIFEPYFTTKHQSKGTGLGLSMTYKLIVEGMHGNITAENMTYNFEGKDYTGAQFTITLPYEKI